MNVVEALFGSATGMALGFLLAHYVRYRGLSKEASHLRGVVASLRRDVLALREAEGALMEADEDMHHPHGSVADVVRALLAEVRDLRAMKRRFEETFPLTGSEQDEDGDCICAEINARHCPVHNEPDRCPAKTPDGEQCDLDRGHFDSHIARRQIGDDVARTRIWI